MNFYDKIMRNHAKSCEINGNPRKSVIFGEIRIKTAKTSENQCFLLFLVKIIDFIGFYWFSKEILTFNRKSQFGEFSMILRVSRKKVFVLRICKSGGRSPPSSSLFFGTNQ